MNETTPSQQADQPLSVPHQGPSAPVGVLTLRQARERAGLHPVALAALLKVPVRRLEALEAGRFEELPDMTFARALALSVCRVLKVDPQPILATFPASAEVRLGELERTLNEPLPQRSMPLTGILVPSIRSRLSWPVALALLLAVLALLLWFLLPQRDAAAPSDPPALVPPVTETAPVGATGVTGAIEPLAPAPLLTHRPTELAAPALPGVGAESVVLPAELAPASVAPHPTPVPSMDSAAGLALRARQAAWVQVTGASGTVLLQRSLQPGELVVLANDFPLSVVVGRADAVEVSLRGQSFDLTPHARNNVARFEVR